MALDINLGRPSALPINLDTTTLPGAVDSEIAGSSQFNRGWQSAGMGEDANHLLSKAREAYAIGDTQGAEALEQQGRDLLARSQQWAPSVKNMTDVTGLRSGLDWAGGALGNVRSSLMPALGSVAGVAIGGLGGALVGGVPGAMTGARYGAGVGSGLMGGKTEYEEAVGNAMMDPEIRATRSYDDIHNAALAKGSINAGLEALVPMGMAKSVFGLASKEALKKATERGVLKTVGKSAAKGGAEEFATEGTQSLVGQGAENWLKHKDLTDFDYKQALNEAAAGAVAGAGMGTVTGAGEALHSGSPAEAGTPAAGEKRTLSDRVADMGAPLAKVFKSGEEKSEIEKQDALDALTASFDMRKYSNFKELTPEERDLPDTPEGNEALVRGVKDRAQRHAESVRDNPAEYSERERTAAAAYFAHKNFGTFDKDLIDAKDKDSLDALSGEIEGKSPKHSMKGAEGEVADKLTDLWLSSHGKDYAPFARQKGTPEAKRAALTLMAWVNSGFGAQHSEDGKQTFLPKALDHFGEDAPEMVKSMVTLAVKQGTLKDASQVARVLKDVKQRVDDDTGDTTFLKDKILPLSRYGDGTEQASRLAVTLRETKGVLSKTQRAAFAKTFGEHNMDAIENHFTPKVKEEVDDHVDGNNAATKRIVDQEERDYEEQQSTQSADRVKEGRRYVGQSKTNEYFDTQDDFHKVQFERMSKEHTAAKGADDAVARSAKKVGKVDREIEKYAESHGKSVEDLSQAEKDSVTREVVHAHNPDLIAIPKTTVKAKSELAKKDHAERRAAYEKKVDQLARAINKRYQTMRIEETEGEAPGINFTEADIKGLEIDYDLRDSHKIKNVKNSGIHNPKLSPKQGRLVLERNGKPFVTSTQMLMAKMFGVRDNTNQSTKDYEGTAQTALQYVSDAIASIQQHEGFSGKVGVIRNGKIEWSKDLPNDLRLWTKDGVDHYVGSARQQNAVQGLQGTRAATVFEMRDKLAELTKTLKGQALTDVATALKNGGAFLKSVFDKHFPHFRVTIDSDFDPSEQNNGSVEIEVGNGMLSDGDPEKEITRDQHGYAATGDDTMKAASIVGRQVAVKKAEPAQDPASTALQAQKEKEAAQAKSLDRLENAKDRVVELLRTNTDALLGKIEIMDRDQLDLASTALFGADWTSEHKHLVNDTVADKTGKPTRVYDKDIGGIRTKETGEVSKYGTTMAGLSGLSGDKLQALYFTDKTDSPNAGRMLAARLKNASDRIKSKIAETISTLDENGKNLKHRAAKTNVAEGSEKAVADKAGQADTGRTQAGVVDGKAATSEELDEAIDKEDFSKFDTKEKLIALAEHAARRDSELEAKDEAGEMLSKKELDIWGLSAQFKFNARSFLKDPANHNGADFASFFDGIEHTDEDVKDLARAFANIKKLSDKKPTKTASTPEQQQAALDAIKTMLGDKINVVLQKADMKGEGIWTPQQTMNMIELAINGDVMGAAFHESFHEIIDILKKNNGNSVVETLQRAAMTPMMQNRLRQALEGHPAAQKQLAQPEEAAAFMFQMWMADPTGFKIGPDTKGAFQKIKDILRSVAGVFSETIRKANAERIKANMEAFKVEELMSFFAEGSLAKDDTLRAAVVAALSKDIQKHNAAVENVGSAWTTLANSAGKLVFSAEAMMDATGNDYMVEVARMFHQKAGTAMNKVGKAFGGYSDGVRQQTSLWLNKAENILLKHDNGDIELAREHLSKGTQSSDPKVQAAINDLRGFMNGMRDYITSKDVRVLDEDGNWKEVKFRKDYWPQVVDMKYLGDHMQEFKDDLLRLHMDVLEGIAAKANAEVKNGTDAGVNSASEMMGAKKPSDRAEITPEMIAESIATRLMNSQGSIDLDEDSSNLGMTPAARAVNRRVLTFLSPEFDKYMSKDVTNIVTTYAHSVVKRAEYQSRFGYGGEKIKELTDKAVLKELGGEPLVAKAEKVLPMRIKAWKKAQAEAAAKGDLRDVPYPTLRSVGQWVHKSAVMAEQVAAGKTEAEAVAIYDAALVKAVGKLEQGMRAVQALEGTLGSDISAGSRAIGSWLVTYQNFRLLSTMLFMSFQDVMGIVREGGEMGDAWKAFTGGISEIKNTWSKTKTPSQMMERAEAWGAVDAGNFAEAVAQSHGSIYMTGKAKELSDKFFKYTGAEGWNRGVRAVASSVAERIITEWKKDGIDTKDKAVQARVDRLFGKGFDVGNIKLDDKGQLDINDPLNQAAITRWMLDAVPAPTAAHRPIWGSDPHFQAFMHLKNYTYTFHRIALKGAVEQAKLGNYRPAAVLAVGYVPIAIAAGAMKEMLIPGDEPPWMKGGLDGYLSYGFARAGLLGVPQMYSESLFNPTQLLDHPSKAFDNFDPAGLFGPTADQAQNILSIPFMEDHGVVGETLGSLPGGNLIKRLERIGQTGTTQK